MPPARIRTIGLFTAVVFAEYSPFTFSGLQFFLAAIELSLPEGALTTLFSRSIPGWSYAFFVQNFFMASRRIFGAEWIAITWSLAVEEQFYLLLPYVVRKLRVRRLVYAAIAAIIGSLILRLVLSSHQDLSVAQYVLLPCRLDALSFGVLIAVAVRNQIAWNWLTAHRQHLYSTLAVLGISFTYFLRHNSAAYSYGLTFFASFYAILLLLVLVNPTAIEKTVFRNTALATMGTLAYAIYMFHQGINGIVHFVLFRLEPQFSGWSTGFATLLSAGLTIGLAKLSWRFLEHPLITLGHAKFRYDVPEEALPNRLMYTHR